MSDAPDLLPCPFCGSSEVRLFPPTCHQSTPYDTADRMYPVARCRNCNAEACGENNDGPRDNRSTQSAVKAWNTRADLPPTREQLAALVRPLEWVESKYHNVVRFTAKELGRAEYEVGTHEHGGFYLMMRKPRGEIAHAVFETLEFAKEAGDREHVARILSAFDIPEGG